MDVPQDESSQFLPRNAHILGSILGSILLVQLRRLHANHFFICSCKTVNQQKRISPRELQQSLGAGRPYFSLGATAWLTVGCPGNRTRLARLRVRRLYFHTQRHPLLMLSYLSWHFVAHLTFIPYASLISVTGRSQEAPYQHSSHFLPHSIANDL